MLYVEGEFLFDDLKWFLGCFTEYDSSQESINVLLSYFKSNDLFIVLGYEKRFRGLTVKGLLYFRVPIPSLGLHFFLCHRKVFLCYCFIVTKGRQLMRKELSPFTCRSHMIYDTTTERFILLDGVGGVEDAIL